MPLYVYECKQCGKRFEKIQPVTSSPITECVECGQGPVRRIIHPVGVIFKGSGWYINDSRKSSGGSSSSAESAGSENGTAPAEKTDSATSKTESATVKTSDQA